MVFSCEAEETKLHLLELELLLDVNRFGLFLDSEQVELKVACPLTHLVLVVAL